MTQTRIDHRRNYTISEVSEFSGYDSSHIRRLVRQGDLEAERVDRAGRPVSTKRASAVSLYGTTLVVKGSELRRFLDEARPGSRAPHRRASGY